MLAIAGWMNRQQQKVIAYLCEENHILREKLGKTVYRGLFPPRRGGRKDRNTGRGNRGRSDHEFTGSRIHGLHR
jgi:hypothetical protein